MKQLPTPPSNEEIQNKANSLHSEETDRQIFIDGAIWMRSQAQPIITELQQQIQLTDHLIEQHDKEMEKLRQENEKLKEIVSSLAEWSKKYPRSRIYSMHRKEDMDGQLIAMEEKAKELMEALKTKE